MISKAMEKAINEQINYELYSAYIYASMSAYFEDKNLPGCAGWMRVQAQEEVGHAMKFFAYMTQAGARVALDSIDKPPATWASPLAVFESALGHEQKVTKRIYKLVELARKESDYATEAMLQWFVTEQVEEESTALDIIHKLKMIGDSPQGLFMMDAQLGGRQPAQG